MKLNDFSVNGFCILILEDGTTAIFRGETEDYWIVDVMHADQDSAKNLEVRKKDIQIVPGKIPTHRQYILI